MNPRRLSNSFWNELHPLQCSVERRGNRVDLGSPNSFRNELHLPQRRAALRPLAAMNPRRLSNSSWNELHPLQCSVERRGNRVDLGSPNSFRNELHLPKRGAAPSP